jgi:hypothetical protein
MSTAAIAFIVLAVVVLLVYGLALGRIARQADDQLRREGRLPR